MAFTNLETVRQHLSETGAVQDTFRDVPVELKGTAQTALLHANLKPESVKVKGKEIGEPHFQQVVLESQPVGLAYQELIPDSVAVASDSSLGKIYTENVDYHVNHAEGKLSRIATGGIAAGASVAVWYYTYKVYAEGTDYLVSYEKGAVRRVASGAIEDGQTVFVDYETLAGGFDDDQIAAAITEADDVLLRLIDPVHHNSSDQTLISAETLLTLAILCRMKATSSLQSGSVVGAAEISRSWRELGEKYDTEGLQLAAPYAAQRGVLNSPSAVRGERMS